MSFFDLISDCLEGKVAGGRGLQTAVREAFSSEAEMVRTFSLSLKGVDILRASQEFDCSYGIADLVIYQLSREWREASGIHALPDGWAYVLTQLPYRKTFSTQDLQSKAGASRAFTLKMLRQFADAGFVKSGRERDTWLKCRQPRPIVREMAAVEAKLSDWQRALRQAIRYRQFAHTSWVLIDAASSRSPIRNIERFKWFNVGLASIDREGQVNVYFRPKRVVPKSPQLYWMANVKLAQQLETSREHGVLPGLPIGRFGERNVQLRQAKG